MYDFKLLFLPFQMKCHVNDSYFAGGSALILQMISTFSSFAAPTKTTLSVMHTGASVNETGEVCVYSNYVESTSKCCNLSYE